MRHPASVWLIRGGRQVQALAKRHEPGEAPNPLELRLKRYEEEIERLRLENEHLRMSATMFGELAERLNDTLRKAGGRGRTAIPTEVRAAGKPPIGRLFSAL